jgi:hypothetical protein
MAAFAYWTAPGSGSASTVVAQLTPPAPSASSPGVGLAHVTWSTVTLDPAVPAVDVEVAFTVERKPSSSSTWVFVCGTGTTPKPYDVLSCDDTPPAADTYDYRVTARLRTWTSSGIASVTVVTDATPPSSAIAFPSATVYSAAGWNAGCTSSICGTATDTGGSGLQKVEVSIRQGSGNYWDGGAFASPSQVWNLASGTSSWMYGFAAGSFPSDGAYTVSTRATDTAANVQSPVTTQTFTIDRTAPSITASTIAATTGTSPGGFVKQGGGYVVYADAADTNGVSSVTADVSTVTTGQNAVALASCASGCTIGGHTYLYKSATLTATNPLVESSKSYTVAAADVVGNASGGASFAVIVDNTGPSVSTVIAATTGASPQGFVKQSGTYRVYANVTDLPSGAGASSGMNGSSLSANVSAVTTGQTAVALSACGGCGPGSVYAYQTAQLTASTPLSEGSKAYSVSASDNLGTGGSSSGASVQVDNTAPSVATVLANTATNEAGWVAQGGGYRVYANVTDLPAGAGAASGVNGSSITANVSTVTSGQTAVALSTSGCPCTISGTSYAYQSAVLTAGNPLSAGSKSFSTSASDNLGSTTSQSGSVTVDNTAPALSTLQMFDTDLDGKVDQVKATFGETLYTYSAGTGPWTPANAPGGTANTLASVSVAAMVATLTFNEGNVNTAAGSFTVALAANASGIRDFAGNQSSFGVTAVADKASPIAVDVQAVNGTGTAGRIDSADVVTYTFSEPMSANSIKAGWSGGVTGVNVALGNSASNDTVAVSTAGWNLGTIATGGNYVASNRTVAANMALVGSTVTLTFTSTAPTGQLNTVASSTMVWTPSTTAADPAGNAMVAAARTQSGAPKQNF